ncbi:hypothetical protein BB559_000777 [Furculomyces boomerangus]|uniref:Uncharacterized protein n=1 Tax=Furculomyces boomerangus TaxID=61424 RepID=A0A2T9Z450_9FUNG|nr:hypothetical protein BB559_000777 [Furculomyces boomerangus]
MRVVELSSRLQWSFQGNIFPDALTTGDIDNDGCFEFIIGNSTGEMGIFKGRGGDSNWGMSINQVKSEEDYWVDVENNRFPKDTGFMFSDDTETKGKKNKRITWQDALKHERNGRKPWAIAKKLGTITAITVGDVCNNGKQAIVVVNGEGELHIFQYPFKLVSTTEKNSNLSNYENLIKSSSIYSNTIPKNSPNSRNRLPRKNKKVDESSDSDNFITNSNSINGRNKNETNRDSKYIYHKDSHNTEYDTKDVFFNTDRNVDSLSQTKHNSNKTDKKSGIISKSTNINESSPKKAKSRSIKTVNIDSNDISESSDMINNNAFKSHFLNDTKKKLGSYQSSDSSLRLGFKKIQKKKIQKVDIWEPLQIYQPNATLEIPMNAERLVVDDIDGDGLKEIIISTSDGFIYSFRIEIEKLEIPRDFLRKNSNFGPNIMVNDIPYQNKRKKNNHKSNEDDYFSTSRISVDDKLIDNDSSIQTSALQNFMRLSASSGDDFEYKFHKINQNSSSEVARNHGKPSYGLMDNFLNKVKRRLTTSDSLSKKVDRQSKRSASLHTHVNFGSKVENSSELYNNASQNDFKPRNSVPAVISDSIIEILNETPQSVEIDNEKIFDSNNGYNPTSDFNLSTQNNDSGNKNKQELSNSPKIIAGEDLDMLSKKPQDRIEHKRRNSVGNKKMNSLDTLNSLIASEKKIESNNSKTFDMNQQLNTLDAEILKLNDESVIDDKSKALCEIMTHGLKNAVGNSKIFSWAFTAPPSISNSKNSSLSHSRVNSVTDKSLALDKSKLQKQPVDTPKLIPGKNTFLNIDHEIGDLDRGSSAPVIGAAFTRTRSLSLSVVTDNLNVSNSNNNQETTKKFYKSRKSYNFQSDRFKGYKYHSSDIASHNSSKSSTILLLNNEGVLSGFIPKNDTSVHLTKQIPLSDFSIKEKHTSQDKNESQTVENLNTGFSSIHDKELQPFPDGTGTENQLDRKESPFSVEESAIKPSPQSFHNDKKIQNLNYTDEYLDHDQNKETKSPHNDTVHSEPANHIANSISFQQNYSINTVDSRSKDLETKAVLPGDIQNYEAVNNITKLLPKDHQKIYKKTSSSPKNKYSIAEITDDTVKKIMQNSHQEQLTSEYYSPKFTNTKNQSYLNVPEQEIINSLTTDFNLKSKTDSTVVDNLKLVLTNNWFMDNFIGDLTLTLAKKNTFKNEPKKPNPNEKADLNNTEIIQDTNGSTDPSFDENLYKYLIVAKPGGRFAPINNQGVVMDIIESPTTSLTGVSETFGSSGARLSSSLMLGKVLNSESNNSLSYDTNKQNLYDYYMQENTSTSENPYFSKQSFHSFLNKKRDKESSFNDTDISCGSLNSSWSSRAKPMLPMLGYLENKKLTLKQEKNGTRSTLKKKKSHFNEGTSGASILKNRTQSGSYRLRPHLVSGHVNVVNFKKNKEAIIDNTKDEFSDEKHLIHKAVDKTDENIKQSLKQNNLPQNELILLKTDQRSDQVCKSNESSYSPKNPSKLPQSLPKNITLKHTQSMAVSELYSGISVPKSSAIDPYYQSAAVENTNLILDTKNSFSPSISTSKSPEYQNSFKPIKETKKYNYKDRFNFINAIDSRKVVSSLKANLNLSGNTKQHLKEQKSAFDENGNKNPSELDDVGFSIASSRYFIDAGRPRAKTNESYNNESLNSFGIQNYPSSSNPKNKNILQNFGSYYSSSHRGIHGNIEYLGDRLNSGAMKLPGLKSKFSTLLSVSAPEKNFNDFYHLMNFENTNTSNFVNNTDLQSKDQNPNSNFKGRNSKNKSLLLKSRNNQPGGTNFQTPSDGNQLLNPPTGSRNFEDNYETDGSFESTGSFNDENLDNFQGDNSINNGKLDDNKDKKNENSELSLTSLEADVQTFVIGDVFGGFIGKPTIFPSSKNTFLFEESSYEECDYNEPHKALELSPNSPSGNQNAPLVNVMPWIAVATMDGILTLYDNNSSLSCVIDLGVRDPVLGIWRTSIPDISKYLSNNKDLSVGENTGNINNDFYLYDYDRSSLATYSKHLKDSSHLPDKPDFLVICTWRGNTYFVDLSLVKTFLADSMGRRLLSNKPKNDGSFNKCAQEGSLTKKVSFSSDIQNETTQPISINNTKINVDSKRSPPSEHDKDDAKNNSPKSKIATRISNCFVTQFKFLETINAFLAAPFAPMVGGPNVPCLFYVDYQHRVWVYYHLNSILDLGSTYGSTIISNGTQKGTKAGFSSDVVDGFDSNPEKHLNFSENPKKIVWNVAHMSLQRLYMYHWIPKSLILGYNRIFLSEYLMNLCFSRSFDSASKENIFGNQKHSLSHLGPNPKQDFNYTETLSNRKNNGFEANFTGLNHERHNNNFVKGYYLLYSLVSFPFGIYIKGNIVITYNSTFENPHISTNFAESSSTEESITQLTMLSKNLCQSFDDPNYRDTFSTEQKTYKPTSFTVTGKNLLFDLSDFSTLKSYGLVPKNSNRKSSSLCLDHINNGEGNTETDFRAGFRNSDTNQKSILNITESSQIKNQRISQAHSKMNGFHQRITKSHKNPNKSKINKSLNILLKHATERNDTIVSQTDQHKASPDVGLMSFVDFIQPDILSKQAKKHVCKSLGLPIETITDMVDPATIPGISKFINDILY